MIEADTASEIAPSDPENKRDPALFNHGLARVDYLDVRRARAGAACQRHVISTVSELMQLHMRFGTSRDRA